MLAPPHGCPALVENTVSEIFSTKSGITSSSFHFENTVFDLEERDIEGTFGFLLGIQIGEMGSSGNEELSM